MSEQPSFIVKDEEKKFEDITLDDIKLLVDVIFTRIDVLEDVMISIEKLEVDTHDIRKKLHKNIANVMRAISTLHPNPTNSKRAESPASSSSKSSTTTRTYVFTILYISLCIGNSNQSFA